MSKNIFFSGDQHHYHSNILYIENRPFSNVPFGKYGNHELGLIERHNEVVSPGDICYHVGDFAFLSNSKLPQIEKILSRLNGRHVLILGNHDEGKPFNYVKYGFESVHTSLILPEDNRFILNHDPAASVVAKDCIWIVAHIHSLFRIQKNCINVGVDVNDYKPISFESIKKEMLNE